MPVHHTVRQRLATDKRLTRLRRHAVQDRTNGRPGI